MSVVSARGGKSFVSGYGDGRLLDRRYFVTRSFGHSETLADAGEREREEK